MSSPGHGLRTSRPVRVRCCVLMLISDFADPPWCRASLPGEWDFEIFSMSARRNGVMQFADSTHKWGYSEVRSGTAVSTLMQRGLLLCRAGQERF